MPQGACTPREGPPKGGGGRGGSSSISSAYEHTFLDEPSDKIMARMETTLKAHRRFGLHGLWRLTQTAVTRVIGINDSWTYVERTRDGGNAEVQTNETILIKVR